MDVLMPQLGETVAEGTISKWFVKAGDAVKPGDNLFEIETDKVSMEVPAIAGGTIAAIHVQAGEVAPVGAVVAVIQGSGEKISTERPALAVPQAPLTPAKAGVQSQAKELDARFRGHERSAESQHTLGPGAPFKMEPFREVRTPERNFGPARLPGGTAITPLARRLAGEAGIDLAKVKGSGPHGRIVARDVEEARSETRAARPAAASTQIVLTADIALVQSLALCAEVPAIALIDVIVKAWAVALRQTMPKAPTEIALAASDATVLIRDAASCSLTAIAAAQNDTSDDARRAGTAIFIAQVPGIASVAHAVRPPQTTMLSIGSRRRTPIEAPDGSIAFAETVTATLACDPGVVDAALGATLLSTFKSFVERPVTMIV
jgi:pyruvate/2-oxoglutarate dehydrogenase complex dihydrolipoamide acyltransferase (E2) component